MKTYIFVPSVYEYTSTNHKLSKMNGWCHYLCSVIVVCVLQFPTYNYIFDTEHYMLLFHWLFALCLKLVMPDVDEDVPTGISLVLQKLLTKEFTQISGQTSRLYK